MDGDLRHHVVDGRLKARGGLACDVVANLVKRISDRELRSDFRDRKPRRLGRQRRRAGNPRVHFDHDDRTVFGIDGELDVGAAGVDADFADDRHRGIAHFLVFAIRQRLRRRNRDRIARVNAHRIEVLDRADDHDVVGCVAHHFEFVFLPAENALFDQALVTRGLAQCPLDEFVELLIHERDAAASAAEREARPDDRGELRVLQNPSRVGDGLRES